MKFFNKWLLAVGLTLAATSAMSADKSQLYGNWKGVSGSAIKIHFKKDMKYVYQYKMLTFSGKWSVSGSNLTLNYTVLGSKKKKYASFSLKKGFLTLQSNEHSNVVLKRVN